MTVFVCAYDEGDAYDLIELYVATEEVALEWLKKRRVWEIEQREQRNGKWAIGEITRADPKGHPQHWYFDTGAEMYVIRPQLVHETLPDLVRLED